MYELLWVVAAYLVVAAIMTLVFWLWSRTHRGTLRLHQAAGLGALWPILLISIIME